MEVWELVVSILGVLLAFIVGVFAEPIKVYFTNKSEKKRLRLALYREMVFIYNILLQIIRKDDFESVESIQRFINIILIKFDCYEYARSNPVIFYQIEEASTINAVYSSFSLMYEQNIQDSLKAIIAQNKTTQDLLMQPILANIKFIAFHSANFMSESMRDGKLKKSILKDMGIDFKRDPGTKSASKTRAIGQED